MTTATAVRAHPIPFDDAKAQAFAGKLLGALNSSALILMTSVGHRTGLFDALAAISPCTIGQLANEADLAERYVREWLAVMTTAGVVDYEPESQTYFLPSEHAAWLTRAAAPNNIAVTAQMIGVAAAVEDAIVDRFRDGHGVHYHAYGRFHEVMGEHTAQAMASNVIEHILPLVPDATTRLERGIDVIDVGCGAGDVLLRLAERFPNSRFTGVDLCADAFGVAAETASGKGLLNLRFQELDVSRIESLGAFDLIFAFDAVHDQKDPQGMLEVVRRSLRPDGTFLMVDIDGSSKLENNLQHPLGAYLYMMSTMHCTPVSLAQGGIGLGTMWGVELASEMLENAGFTQVALTRLPHDPFNAYFVARP
ncbi:MAG TPA: class I SAM-dependent methyltransferase [Devosiaceae bacterium]|jgi:SAM-dependent methyltransferase|nr:class I SAM-dependent methyltransferase [Devosiaceae bacterium]